MKYLHYRVNFLTGLFHLCTKSEKDKQSIRKFCGSTLQDDNNIFFFEVGGSQIEHPVKLVMKVKPREISKQGVLSGLPTEPPDKQLALFLVFVPRQIIGIFFIFLDAIIKKKF